VDFIDNGFWDDSSNDGEIINAIQTRGYLGKGFEFDGDGDYVEVPSLDELYSGDDVFSVSGWFKTSKITGIQTIVGQWGQYMGTGPGYNGWQILVEGGVVKARFGSYSFSDIVGERIVTDNNWHHFTLVYPTSTSNAILYVDGISEGTPEPKSIGIGDTKFRIGDGSYETDGPVLEGGPFNGIIDDVMIFERALIEDEIIALYTDGSLSDDFSVDFEELDLGTHSFNAYAQDGAGNIGEAGERSVEITISQPPEIVYISDLGYVNPEDGGTVAPADRILVGDGVATKNFEFFVWSVAGVNALPGPGGNAVTDANVLISIRDFINPPNRRRDSSEAGGVSCVYDRDVNAPVGSIVGYVGLPTRVYRCSIGMYYYDDYGSFMFLNWKVFAYIEDNWGQAEGWRDGAMVGDNAETLPNRDTYFDLLGESKIVPVGGIMDFGSSVSYGPQITQPTDVAGTYPLRIRNTGNTDVSPIRLRGEDIPGSDRNDEYILASWFKMSGAASDPCAGTSLVDGIQVDTGMPQIDNGPAAYGDLRVCLTNVEATASEQTYTTIEAVNGVAWNVDTTV